MKSFYCFLCFLILGLTACASPVVAAGEPPPVVDTGADPETWVLVPAGEFLLGQHQHEVPMDDDYEIMLTDVTTAQYAQYLNEALSTGLIRLEVQVIIGFYPGDEFHGYKHEEEIPEGDYIHMPLDEEGARILKTEEGYIPTPGFENHPMVMVSWFGAKEYCEFHGWRLPTELEWEKAARGTDGRAFPWGNEIERNNANFYSSHDLFEKLWGGAGGTTPVGFYNGRTYGDFKTLDSRSPYGLFDMAGNVWQWTGDVYEDQHYRYMRGGSKESYAYNLRVWTRNSAGPEFYSPSVGFRCTRAP